MAIVVVRKAQSEVLSALRDEASRIGPRRRVAAAQCTTLDECLRLRACGSGKESAAPGDECFHLTSSMQERASGIYDYGFVRELRDRALLKLFAYHFRSLLPGVSSA